MLALVLLASCSSAWHAEEEPARNARSGYRVVHGWPTLPAGEVLGQATGVGVDSHNHVFVFHRAGRAWSDPFPTAPIERATITVFDGATGNVVASWGANTFIMPHGLSVDAENNIWVTDVGLHQVFKFTHDGQLLLTVGTPGASGADGTHFNRPTDVAVSRSGSFYVSDGYINTRVAKFAGSGEFVMQWGRRGSAPGEFDLPHGIALDAQARLYVADRTNARVQVFDTTGKYLAEIKRVELGRPYGVAVMASRLLVADGGDQPSAPPDRSRVSELTLEGTITSGFGRFGNQDGQFRIAHDVAIAADGAVYVVDVSGQRVQKFIR